MEQWPDDSRGALLRQLALFNGSIKLMRDRNEGRHIQLLGRKEWKQAVPVSTAQVPRFEANLPFFQPATMIPPFVPCQSNYERGSICRLD
jgi:hypothetical protein